jgi:hypothetical protein
MKTDAPSPRAMADARLRFGGAVKGDDPMTTTPYFKWAAAAALLLAPPGAFARDAVHSASNGVRSSQALPAMTTKAYHAHAGNVDEIARAAAASPAYCSGNKYGLYNGQGAAHGNGKPFTCGKSPG